LSFIALRVGVYQVSTMSISGKGSKQIALRIEASFKEGIRKALKQDSDASVSAWIKRVIRNELQSRGSEPKGWPMTEEQNTPPSSKQKRREPEKKPMEFPLESFLKKLKKEQHKWLNSWLIGVSTTGTPYPISNHANGTVIRYLGVYPSLDNPLDLLYYVLRDNEFRWLIYNYYIILIKLLLISSYNWLYKSLICTTLNKCQDPMAGFYKVAFTQDRHQIWINDFY